MEDADALRSRLFTLLRPARLREHPELAAVLEELGIGAGYARNHLLSLGGWPEDVVALVEDGLPLTVGRKLAQHDDDTRAEALRRAARLERGTRGQRVAAALAQVLRERAFLPPVLDDEWLSPAATSDAPPSPPGDVWRFPTLGPAGRAAEELHPDLVHALLGRYVRGGSASWTSRPARARSGASAPGAAAGCGWATCTRAMTSSTASTPPRTCAPLPACLERAPASCSCTRPPSSRGNGTDRTAAWRGAKGTAR